MVTEILLGICIGVYILYMLYMYLEWCSTYSGSLELYRVNPTYVVAKDRAVLDKWHGYMLPTYMADTFKPIRFWFIYAAAKY